MAGRRVTWSGSMSTYFTVNSPLRMHTAMSPLCISTLWLLPDLTLAGLLSRSWGEGPWPAGAVAAGLGLALAGVPALLTAEALCLGGLALAALTLILSPGRS